MVVCRRRTRRWSRRRRTAASSSTRARARTTRCGSRPRHTYDHTRRRPTDRERAGRGSRLRCCCCRSSVQRAPRRDACDNSIVMFEIFSTRFRFRIVTYRTMDTKWIALTLSAAYATYARDVLAYLSMLLINNIVFMFRF